MRLYQRTGQPAWYMDASHPVTGQRVRESTGETVKAKAMKVALRRVQELAGKAVGMVDGRTPTTVAQALEDYVASLIGRPSQANYRGLAPIIAKGIGPDLPLHMLTTADLTRYVADRSITTSNATIAHDLSMLRSAVAYADAAGRRVPHIVDWRRPRITTKTRYLSREEWNRLYYHLAPTAAPEGAKRTRRTEVQDMALALVYTGARWREIADLRWPQVDLDRHTIRLWGEKVQKERVVPIHPQVYAMLVRRAAEATNLRVFGEQPDGACQPLLEAMDRIGLNSPDSVARHGSATVHSLRHTFASWALEAGMTLTDLQALLGHASVAQTMRYAHLSQRGLLDRTASTLEAM